MNPASAPDWAVDLYAKKCAVFEQASGYPRTPAEVDAITGAAYDLHPTYAQAEKVFSEWVTAPVDVAYAVRCIRAGVSRSESRRVWEPRRSIDPERTDRELDFLGALMAR